MRLLLMSRASPIRLEKNGRASLKKFPKEPNKSLLSIKNCRRSGKRNSKRVRLVKISSTSTLEKSGLNVKSKFSPSPIAILASPPTKIELSAALSSKSFCARPFTYGIKVIGVLDFPSGFSKIRSSANANVPNNCVWGTRVKVLVSLD